MAEEHNRVVTDHVADLLFCPTKTAVINLEREGITNGVHLVGDVMYDSLLDNAAVAEKRSKILGKLNLQEKRYVLVTVHRAENTDKPERLDAIFRALNKISEDGLDVVVPLHPRTQKKLGASMQSYKSLKLIDPVSYMDILLLEKQARVILTDSGGIQKEAYWFGVPCVTLRDETEWVETVNSGWNVLVGADSELILRATRDAKPGSSLQDDYGDGKAAEKIREILSSN
jgi:UDP-N-acetylglucosamine 2-epimerase